MTRTRVSVVIAIVGLAVSAAWFAGLTLRHAQAQQQASQPKAKGHGHAHGDHEHPAVPAAYANARIPTEVWTDPKNIHGHHFRITATDGEDIPFSAQWPETTALVAVGQTRNVELITDAPGDWAFHCHMTHHVMNQMGHEFPNMVGMKTGELDEKIRPLLPAYMTHGHTGMDMGKMAEVMPYPRNTISMKGATGPFGDYISMGGLFTIVKVRDRLKSYDEDPGWYQNPPGTVALKASDAELARDGIDVNESSARGGQSAPGPATKRPPGVDSTPRPMDPHKRH